MFQSIELFQTAAAMAQHAGARQAVTAANVANADTPGYQAQRLPKFSEIHSQDASMNIRTSRDGHLTSTGGTVSNTAVEAALSGEPAPNGNSVSVEEEMLHSVEIMREHSRALAVYRHTLTVLRTTIGR